MEVTQKHVEIDINNMPHKFAVFQTDVAHARLVQEWLIKNLGARWGSYGVSGATVQNVNKEVIYLRKRSASGDGWSIVHSDKDYYLTAESEEYPLLEFTPVTMLTIKRVVNLLEVDGKKYDANQIKRLIKESKLSPQD